MEEQASLNTHLTKVHVETKFSKTVLKKYKSKSKTLKRRNRRKRSKKAYIKSLRKRRVHRGTEELCTGLEQFSVLDMEMTPTNGLDSLPQEILEWQKQEQIAYWKSRAISLEIENRMLHQHLRNVYAQQVEYYQNNSPKNPNDTKQKSNYNQQTVDNIMEINTQDNETQNIKPAGRSRLEKNSEKVIPKVPEGKYRLDEMKKLYGDMAPKIMGMETAIDLNFEHLKEEGSYVNWPNIPLKL